MAATYSELHHYFNKRTPTISHKNFELHIKEMNMLELFKKNTRSENGYFNCP